METPFDPALRRAALNVALAIRIDFGSYIAEIADMIEKDTHIVSRFTGIPMADAGASIT